MQPRHPVFLATLLTAAACGGAHEATPGGAIITDSLLTLGASTDSGALTAWPSAVRAIHSGFVVSSSPVPPRGADELLPHLYDRRGHFTRMLGRRGDGPGEFQIPTVWDTLPGDSLLVTDLRRPSATILSADGAFGRSFPLLGGARQVVVTADGDLVVNAPYNGLGSTWAPLVRTDRQGTVKVTFGGDSAGCGRYCGELGGRALVADADGGVWAAWQLKAYVLEHYDHRGRLIRRFRPSATWFAQIDSFPPPAGDQHPPSMIQGLQQDAAGHLWIIASTADPHWERGLGPAKPGEGGRAYRPVTDIAAYLDGVIEVRDTVTGALLATRRFPLSGLLPVGPTLIAQIRTNEDGAYLVDLLRMSLRQ
jgi:hypothetical protein